MESICSESEVLEMYAKDLMKTMNKNESNVDFSKYVQWLTLQEIIKIRKLLEAKSN